MHVGQAPEGKFYDRKKLRHGRNDEIVLKDRLSLYYLKCPNLVKN